jgi:two-component system sensor histidine kinase TctE
LSIVREIARVHQGSVTLADAAGGGLIVTIRLPAARAVERARSDGA